MTGDVHRLAAGHTHLYPGATLRSIGGEPLEATRRLLIEFTDGEVVDGRFVDDGGASTISVEAYRTRGGADIEAKRWRVAKQADGTIRVTARA